MSKRTKLSPKREELIDQFADIFHSFKDLTKVTPLALLAKLERKGITISRKPKRSNSPAVREGKS
jgi:hypothetical protein